MDPIKLLQETLPMNTGPKSNLNTARINLLRMTKDLSIRWIQTTEAWDDTMSRRFDREILEPLRRTVEATSTSMETMNESLARAHKDCK